MPALARPSQQAHKSYRPELPMFGQIARNLAKQDRAFHVATVLTLREQTRLSVEW
jgi:hypothetical protein